MNILTDVKQYVTLLLKNQLPKTLTFHDYLHTREVVNAVYQIGKNSGLSKKELEIVAVAAWFHDTGHTISYDGHEEHSKRIAKDFLSDLKYNKKKIQKVNDCIQATKLPQNPLDKLEEVLCDADLFHLSQKNFFNRNELLRREWELVFHKYYTYAEWYELNINFLKEHQYFSLYGKHILEKQKRLNLNRLLSLYNSSKKAEVSKFRRLITP